MASTPSGTPKQNLVPVCTRVSTPSGIMTVVQYKSPASTVVKKSSRVRVAKKIFSPTAEHSSCIKPYSLNRRKVYQTKLDGLDKPPCKISNTDGGTVIEFNTVLYKMFRRCLGEFYSEVGKEYKVTTPVCPTGARRMVFKILKPTLSRRKLVRNLRSTRLTCTTLHPKSWSTGKAVSSL